MEITPYALVKAIGADWTRINRLIRAQRSVTVDTGLAQGGFFKMSLEFWLDAQSRYDLEEERLHGYL